MITYFWIKFWNVKIWRYFSWIYLLIKNNKWNKRLNRSNLKSSLVMFIKLTKFEFVSFISWRFGSRFVYTLTYKVEWNLYVNFLMKFFFFFFFREHKNKTRIKDMKIIELFMFGIFLSPRFVYVLIYWHRGYCINKLINCIRTI